MPVMSRAELVPAIRHMQGTIYLIQIGPYTKIGRTSNLARRLYDYKRTEIPYPIKQEYTYTVENYQEVEVNLLRWYNHKLVKGNEWFDLTKRDIWRIRRYLKSVNTSVVASIFVPTTVDRS